MCLLINIPPNSEIILSRTAKIKAVDLGDYIERSALIPLQQISISVSFIDRVDLDILTTELSQHGGNIPTQLSYFNPLDLFLIQEFKERPLVWQECSSVDFTAVEQRRLKKETADANQLLEYPALDGSKLNIVYRNYNSQYGDGKIVARNKGNRLKDAVWDVTFHLTPVQAISLDLLLANLRGIYAFAWSPNNTSDAKSYLCDGWSINFVSDNLYIFSGKFVLDRSQYVFQIPRRYLITTIGQPIRTAAQNFIAVNIDP